MEPDHYAIGVSRMAERTVSVKLIADARAYIQGMDEVSRKTKDTTQSIEQQLADQQRAFETVGVAAVAVGTAIVGIGVAALNTGINYNTLQQTSRAALETLLGSAEAANAQMDKLDEFARTSPFAKQVFIEAQQQLLGFGTEAERVVPILDAIQNAVAATGGSNEDIAELTRIIAQLEGGVKLSAETLNQFGTRGIDAAQLIGDAMGKTGEQIRSEITAGTLDASDAIVALTDGMQERFGGAAENVKETFDGAVDRVKAAWRDLAAEIAEPLVDPEGGGALIDFLNVLADVMREFEGLPDPVQNTIIGLGGLTGVLALAGGAALLAIPKIAEFRVALSTLGITAGTTTGALGRVTTALMGPWGIAIAGAATGIWLIDEAQRAANLSADEWTAAMERGATAADLFGLANQEWIAGANETFGIMGRDTFRLVEDMEQVPAILDRLTAQSDNFWENFNAGENMGLPLGDFNVELGRIDDRLGSMDFATAQAGFDALVEGMGLNSAQADQLLGLMDQTAAVLDETGPAAEAAAGGVDAVGEAMATAAEAAQEMLDAQQAIVDAFFASQDAMAGYEQTVDAIAAALTEGLTPAVTENGEAFDLGEQSGRDAAGMLADLVVSAQDATQAMRDNGASAGEMAGYQETARARIYDTAIQMGLSEDAARAYADRLLEIPEGVSTQVVLDTSGAEAAISRFVNQRRVATIELAAGPVPSIIARNGVATAYAGGGRIPGYSPGIDDRLGFLNNGNVVGLAGGEWIINAAASQRYHSMLEQINAGTFPGYAGGGRISEPVYQPSFNPVINVSPAQVQSGSSPVTANFYGVPEAVAGVRQLDHLMTHRSRGGRRG